MDRTRVEDLLRRRGRTPTGPLLSEAVSAELHARVSADARRTVAAAAPWKRPVWLAAAAGMLLLASLVVMLQRSRSFGSVPVRGSFADARGRDLSSIRSDETRSLPREFWVSVRPEQDAYVRLLLYGRDGSRYELATQQDAATSRLPPELFNLGPYRLEEDSEEPLRGRVDLLILSSSREIPEEAIGEDLLPENLAHPSGDERTRELESLARRAREGLGCFVVITTLSPDSP